MGVTSDEKEPTGLSTAPSHSDANVEAGDVEPTLERRAQFETQRGLSPRHVQLSMSIYRA